MRIRIVLVVVIIVVVSAVSAGRAGPPCSIPRGANDPPCEKYADRRIEQCTVIAIAQNLRGALYEGYGPTPARAFEQAMSRCTNGSWMTCTCKIISIRCEPVPCAMDPLLQENRGANFAHEYWRYAVPIF